jgi:hypothetical protein
MFDFTRRHPRLLFLIGATVLVGVPWVVLLIITLQPYRAGSAAGMTALGQFGDSFGSLNALFTGLALAGLVYTAHLQRRQLDAQRTEIAAQEEAARENRLAVRRQSREQHLTALLNANVALSQAHGVIVAQSAALPRSYQSIVLRKQSIRLKQDISLLRCEARFGFEDELPKTEKEMRVIREYLHEFFRDFKTDCPVEPIADLACPPKIGPAEMGVSG